MPATFVTEENFPPSTNKRALDRRIRLAVKAGAIRSWIKKESKYTICTEWNVIGSND